MNTIDELINKIRSKKIKKEEPHEDTTDLNTNPMNNTEALDNYKESQDMEIVTSQVYPSTHSTTDFKVLQSIKNKIKDFIEIQEIKETEKYKIEMCLIVIVKRIIKYDNIVCGIELIDETGEIKGSLLCETIHTFNIKIGSVILLENFSLWKIKETHLNISSECIKEVI